MALPRQHSVDQMKRLRQEIKKQGGDIGDKAQHFGNTGNAIVDDNVLDRHIDSYEEFTKHDNKIVTKAMTESKDELSDNKNKGKGLNGDTDLYGDMNRPGSYTNKVKNQGNKTLDYMRLGKQVNMGSWEGFIDKIENEKIYIRERIGGKIVEMSFKEFFKSYKEDENGYKVFKFEDLANIPPTTQKESNTDVVTPVHVIKEGKIIKFDDFTVENMIPKKEKTVKCLECGEWITDDIQAKEGHVANKHFAKPDVDNKEIKEKVDEYFFEVKEKEKKEKK
jgi:tRNA(Leu) C34 or U34 (ribose-2'-O)-methylase TrmL